MHIGLIGGIGPAATVLYYQRLVAAFGAAQLPLSLTISHASIEDLAAHAKADDRAGQARVFARHLAALEGAGCDIALITALTGHFCFDETQALAGIAMLDGVEVIDRFCAAQGIRVLGLLGSPPVMSTHLFHRLNRVQTVVPDTGLDRIGAAYMALARSGTCSVAQRQMFLETATRMVEAQGADAVLLAGTDLGLAFDGHSLPFPVIDAVEVHIQSLLQEAIDRGAGGDPET